MLVSHLSQFWITENEFWIRPMDLSQQFPFQISPLTPLQVYHPLWTPLTPRLTA